MMSNPAWPKHWHSVIVQFMYYKESLDPLHELEDRLRRVIEDKGVGFHDGHEINMDMSDGYLFMYGPNAEVLFKTVKPILEETDFTRNAVAYIRFGPPDADASEIEVNIAQ
jgi:hypothetical protein